MTVGKINHRPRCGVLFMAALLLFAPFTQPISSNAQVPEKVRTVPGQFFQEANCPVSVTQTRADLDLDPFDAPIDARVYVTYVNSSTIPVAAVNFRIRLADATGKNLGTFRASDSALIEPGQEHSQKWKHERVNPATAVMQVRVLQVKYADGSMWESYKLKEIDNPQPQGDDAQGDQPSQQVNPNPDPNSNPGL